MVESVVTIDGFVFVICGTSFSFEHLCALVFPTLVQNLSASRNMNFSQRIAIDYASFLDLSGDNKV